MEFESINTGPFDPSKFPNQASSSDIINSNSNFGGVSETKSAPYTYDQVNDIHAASDVDSNQKAKHHTLGIRHLQASPGDHNHDGTLSRKAGYGLGLTITGSRGGNAAVASIIALLKNVIDFTDGTTA